MAMISLDDARPGMTLAADVTDARGRLLVPADAALCHSLVESLRARGVTYVSITPEDRPYAEPAALPPEVREALIRRVDELFQRADTDDPIVGAIRDYALERASIAAASSLGAA